jgi:hypothetical protein
VLDVLEPLIVQQCCKMPQIAMSMNCANVIDIVNDMIQGTDFEKSFLNTKKRYNKFMKRHKATLKRGCCKSRDINWYNWCTMESFASMYKGVYSGMVNAGIAVELENEILYDNFGEITTDEKEIYRCLTHRKITHPEYLFLVDETG